MTSSLSRRAVAEFTGTAFLVSAVVGSGVMAERLANGNTALALLANTIATGAALVALIFTFAQILGGMSGAILAHLMFELPIISVSRHARGGPAQAFSEFIATFGLMSIIWGCSRLRSSAIPFAVGAYITAAYWFTASTSFANPAVTLARCLSDTFAGIRPSDAPPFIAAQFAGGLAATLLFRWLVPNLRVHAKDLFLRDHERP